MMNLGSISIHNLARTRWSYLLLLLLTAGCLIPLWTLEYIPTQDGPSHLYNVHVLRQLLSHTSVVTLQTYFRINPIITPNIMGTGMLLLLTMLFPLLIAEKILVTIIALLLPITLLYVIRAFDRRQWVFALTGVLFALHNLLLLGFYNFSLGTSLALFTLGFWLRHRKSLSWRNVLLFVALTGLTYLGHIAPFVFLLIALVCVTGQDLLLALSNKERPLFRPALIANAVALTPAFGLGLHYVLTHVGSETIHISPALIWRIFAEYSILATYTDRHIPIVHIFQALMGIALIITVVQRIQHRQWRSERDSMLWLSIILLVAFFVFPWWQNNGGWINNRFFLFFILSLSCWCAIAPTPPSSQPSRSDAIQHLLAAGFLLIIVARTLLLAQEWTTLQPELGEFARLSTLIKPHTTVTYDRDSATYSTGLQTNTVNIAPFRHAACYAALGQDVVYTDNYEAKFDYFPVRWQINRPDQPADYIVIRHAIRNPPPDQLGNYRQVWSGHTVSLFEKTEQ